jgi:Protein of unknown function C-terminus (DUF2399)
VSATHDARSRLGSSRCVKLAIASSTQPHRSDRRARCEWTVFVWIPRRAAAAVKRTPVREELGPDMVRASWDDRLAEAMAAAGARIYEEHVLDDLLVDLSTTPTVARRGGTR